MDYHEQFTNLDWLLVAAYLGLTTLVGHLLKGKQSTIKDFFWVADPYLGLRFPVRLSQRKSVVLLLLGYQEWFTLHPEISHIFSGVSDRLLQGFWLAFSS